MPLLPLLIFFVFVFGAQLWLILLLLVAFSWPGLTILVRSMVLGLSGSQEVEAARALGASSRHILVKHIFPHTAPYVFTQLIFFVPAVILAEAGLSFLGLGRSVAADVGPDPRGRLPNRRGLPGLLVVGGLPWPAHRPHGHDLHAAGAGHGAHRQPQAAARLMALLEVRDLAVEYTTERGPLRAVDGISFDLEEGEALGIIGESGSGKTSLAITLMRLLPQNGTHTGRHHAPGGRRARARLSDEDFRRRIRWSRMAMVFQGAMHSLNPVIRVGDQVAERLRADGVSKAEARGRVEELLTRVGLPVGHARALPP